MIKLDEVNLTELDKDFAPKLKMLIDLIKQEDLPFVIFETLRPLKKQQEYFMRGRALKGKTIVVVDKSKVITNAKPGQSPHSWSCAADLVLDPKHPKAVAAKCQGFWDTRLSCIPFWKKLGLLAVQAGLTWGGNWKSIKDLPHVELPTWKTKRPANWETVVATELSKS